MLLAALLAADAAGASTCAGPHAVGTTQLTLVDPARNNRAVATRVHYPAAGAGAGTPAVTGCGFPVVAFGHGFTIANSAYGYLADALAGAGFIVMLPGTEGGLSPDHAEFGRDLAFVGDALAQDSPWTLAAGPGRVIGGHSMGGGAAVLGAAGASHIDALFAFAPANTNPSAITAPARISVPALLITGSRDCVTPNPRKADSRVGWNPQTLHRADSTVTRMARRTMVCRGWAAESARVDGGMVIVYGARVPPCIRGEPA